MVIKLLTNFYGNAAICFREMARKQMLLYAPCVYIQTDGRKDGQTDEAATICSPVGEHKKGAMMALDRSHEIIVNIRCPRHRQI